MNKSPALYMNEKFVCMIIYANEAMRYAKKIYTPNVKKL